MLCELVGPTPTNTMKLCQGKQIWREAEEGNEEGDTEREKKREKEKCCPKRTRTFGALDKHSNSCKITTPTAAEEGLSPLGQ